jgi:hypothetical protein
MIGNVQMHLRIPRATDRKKEMEKKKVAKVVDILLQEDVVELSSIKQSSEGASTNPDGESSLKDSAQAALLNSYQKNSRN